MKRSPQPSQLMRLLLALMAATLLSFAACSHQVGASGLTDNAKAGQLPFDRVSDGAGTSPTKRFDLDEIPAGTQLNIRLQLPLSSAGVRAGDSFSAVLDDPVIVGEKTIVPRGALITGSVMAAKASAESHDPGYLRLTLVSMAVNGKTIPLRTSSVFAKGGSYVSSPTITGSRLSSTTGGESSSNHFKDDVRFSTGHRLTFRLAQPIQSQS
jgi:hypothetical protein